MRKYLSILGGLLIFCGSVQATDYVADGELTLTITTPTASEDTLSGSMASDWKVTKDGTGTLVLGQLAGENGNLAVDEGTLKIDVVSPLAATSKITLAGGTTLDLNGKTIENGTQIVTTGAATITSSLQVTQNGINNVLLGGDLTVSTPVRWCITGPVAGGGNSIIKTGGNEVVVKGNITNLAALYINEGTWAVEHNVTGFGDGDIYLGANGTMKVWGNGRSVTFDTLHHQGGLVKWYANTYWGTTAITGDIILEADDARFEVSSTATFTGNITGADKTLVHSAIVNNVPEPSGDGTEQTGVWTFQGTSATDKGTVTVKNFQLTTRDSEIILGDYAEWNISGGITGSSTGHKFTVGANAILTAGSMSGITRLKLNGTSTIGTLTMDGGTILADAGVITTTPTNTMTGNLVVEENGLIMDVATNLQTTGTISGTADSLITKTGEGTWVISHTESTGYAGKLAVNEGTLKVTSTTQQDMFGSGVQITIDNGSTLDLRGVLCTNGTITVGNNGGTILLSGQNHSGVSNVDLQGDLTFGGNSRSAIALKNANGNGNTIYVKNPYMYTNQNMQNVNFVVESGGSTGFEVNQTGTGTASTGGTWTVRKGGKLGCWFGNIRDNSTGYTMQIFRPNAIIMEDGSCFKIDGGVRLEAPVSMTGSVSFTNGGTSGSVVEFSQKVSAENASLTLTDRSTVMFSGEATVGAITLTTGSLQVMTGGTLTTDSLTVNRDLGTDTWTWGTTEAGLIVNGGTLITPTSVVAENKTMELRSGNWKHSGTMSETATIQANGGTFWLADGMDFAANLQLNENAVLEVGLDKTDAAQLTLSGENRLAGEIAIDILADGTFDQLIIGADTAWDAASLEVYLPGTALDGVSQTYDILSGIDATVLEDLLVNFHGSSGWAYGLTDGTLSVWNRTAVPEPGTWGLLVLGLLSLGWWGRKNAGKSQK
ncbi:MAG: PEP-CTERM sorting domain-containing protein [Planctomycetia bacterium]|nr:PEP-CTERM sorting domain-containing protein [Planctomycetia bacterium]